MSDRLSSLAQRHKITSYTVAASDLVTCVERDERPEMGNKQNTPKSSQQDEISSTQERDCDSPIWFPSPELEETVEVTKMENGDCKKTCEDSVNNERSADDDVQFESSSELNSHVRMSSGNKGKARLSLGKRRQMCDQGAAKAEGSNDVGESEAKQRRLADGKITANLTVVEEEKPRTNVKRKQELNPIQLLRLYNCGHSVCRTLEEADKRNLYFAPRGVQVSRYSEVIVRKFESYRQRLHKAQSRLSILHPFGDPIQPMAVTGSRRRTGTRAKRTSVVIRNTREAVNQTDENKGFVVVEASSPERRDVPLKDSPRLEGHNGCAKLDTPEVQVTVPPVDIIDTQPPVVEIIPDSTQASVPTGSKTPPRRSSHEHDVVTVTTDDEVALIKGDDIVMETNSAHASSSPEALLQLLRSKRKRTETKQQASSPIKMRLSTNARRAILEEVSSDEEELGFSFRKPKSNQESHIESNLGLNPKSKPESFLVSDSVGNAKPESATVFSRESAATSGTGDEPWIAALRHECPMCFRMFSEERIHAHAATCNGAHEIMTRSSRAVSVLDDEVTIHDGSSQKQSNESLVDCKTEKGGNMSPVIKVRTPTKVRELKLLSPSVAVRNLARELSTQPASGERVNMFGVNVMLSPKMTRAVAKSRLGSLTSDGKMQQRAFGEGKGFGRTCMDEQGAIQQGDEVLGAVGAPGSMFGANVSLSPKWSDTGANASIGEEIGITATNRVKGKRFEEGKKGADGTLAVQRMPSKRKLDSEDVIRELEIHDDLEGEGGGATGVDEPSSSYEIEDKETRRAGSRPWNLRRGNPSITVEGKRKPLLFNNSLNEDETETQTPVRINEIVDDTAASEQFASSDQRRKRKLKTRLPTDRKKRSKTENTPAEDSLVEYCSFCRTNIPVESFPEHVSAEITQRKLNEAQQGNDVTKTSSYVTTTSTRSSNQRFLSASKRQSFQQSRKSRDGGKNDSNLCLPDLAQATTGNVDADEPPESPLKTYRPLDQGSASGLDYYNQFSSASDSRESSRQVRKRKRNRRKK